MNASLPIASALLGVIVLFFGRKLFWLCVAAFGFAAGVELAPHLIQQPTPLLQLSIALALGFIGAVLALFLQKLAIGVVGFAAGGRLAVALAASFFVQHESYYWLTFIIGGVIGAILLMALFDWALILFSSLLGAYLILGAVTLPSTGATLMLIALTVLGVIVQASIFRRGRAVEP
jgi:hypothetical protein